MQLEPIALSLLAQHLPHLLSFSATVGIFDHSPSPLAFPPHLRVLGLFLAD